MPIRFAKSVCFSGVARGLARAACLLAAAALFLPASTGAQEKEEREPLPAFAWAARDAGPEQWHWIDVDPLRLPGGSAEGPLAVFSVRAQLPVHEGREEREAWARALTRAARVLSRRARVWVVQMTPADGTGPEGAAFLHKRAAVAIRAADPEVPVFLAGASDPSVLARMYEVDLAAYVDGVVADLPKAGEPYPFTQLLDERDINARRWIRAPDGAQAGAVLLRALASGADGVLLPSGAAEAAGVADLLPEKFSLRSARLAPGETGAGLSLRNGSERVQFVRVLDLDSFGTLLLYAKEGDDTQRVTVDVVGVGHPRIRDLGSGDALPGGMVVEEPRSASTSFDLPGEAGSLVSVQFAELALVERGERAEKIGVRGDTLPPVEKIIAAHQAWHAEQDTRLHTYVAEIFNDMTLSAGSREANLGIESRLFYRRGEPAEYENVNYYLGGVRVKRQNVVNLPLVQPEKVQTLPLDVILNKAYRYTLKGRTTIEGRTAYRVAFEPLTETATAFRGEVWIDARDWSRLRLQVVQTGLEPPVLSYEQIQEFRDYDTGDGTFRLPRLMTIQQTFTTLGATITARARVSYKQYDINAEDYATRLETAYDSTNQMMRDTDEGMRYLLKDEETGGRVVQSELPKKTRLWLAGVRYDGRRDYPIPLGGVNFLNFDWRNKGIQTNFFLAGVVNRISLSDPAIGESRWGWDAQFAVDLIPFTDRAVDSEGNDIDEEELRVFSEGANASLWHPIGNFTRLAGTLGLEYNNHDDTDDTREDFRIPEDNVTTTLGLSLDYRRGGWNVDAWGEYGARSAWEAWGVPTVDEDPGVFEDAEEFTRYGLSVSKTWRFRQFQSVGVTLEAMDGEDLDRFSQFEAGTFSNPVGGFDGAGLRWDTGTIARLSYGWSLFEIAGVDVRFDWARVRDESVADEFFDNQGVQLDLSFPGPKGTFLDVDLGYAIHSELYPEAEGDFTVQILVFRLF